MFKHDFLDLNKELSFARLPGGDLGNSSKLGQKETAKRDNDSNKNEGLYQEGSNQICQEKSSTMSQLDES